MGKKKKNGSVHIKLDAKGKMQSIEINGEGADAFFRGMVATTTGRFKSDEAPDILPHMSRRTDTVPPEPPNTLSPVFCEHANEVPQTCPCPPNCYCKNHTCKNR
jgi:hypothetical protein